MHKKRNVVIDASIARASSLAGRGGDVGPICREFLLSVVENKLFFVISPTIKAEWKRHASAFATTWLVQMYGTKSFVRLDEDEIPASLLDEIQSLERLGDAGKYEITKDLHLVFAARSTNAPVITLETHFRDLCRRHIPKMITRFKCVWIVLPKYQKIVSRWCESECDLEEFSYMGK